MDQRAVGLIEAHRLLAFDQNPSPRILRVDLVADQQFRKASQQSLKVGFGRESRGLHGHERLIALKDENPSLGRHGNGSSGNGAVLYRSNLAAKHAGDP